MFKFKEDITVLGSKLSSLAKQLFSGKGFLPNNMSPISFILRLWPQRFHKTAILRLFFITKLLAIIK